MQFNDGRKVSRELIGEAVEEIAEQFQAVSLETQVIEGRWFHTGNVYQDQLLRLFVDIPELRKNRTWMKSFKAKWKGRLEQLELWMVSYRIEIE